ncbi:hypothetical protein B0H14DRAFT_2742299 [Mycena olivaceomarginata]|nr:hypothetical protein B0H14DRAFT_2742299 [Mycena olivaceomarginata]
MQVDQNRSIVEHSPPRLPPELERTIFELAARSSPGRVPSLMLIAWRVKNWLEPLLYRVMCISSTVRKMHGFPVIPIDALFRAMLNKAPLDAVEYLFLQTIEVSPTSAIVDAILQACPHITHLFSSLPLKSNLKALESLHCLRRLTVDTTRIFVDHPFDFTHPLFRNLTHLELTDKPRRLEAPLYARLTEIPNLTHICFNAVRLFSVVYPLLASSTRLQLIVLLSTAEKHTQDKAAIHPQPRMDDRFVHTDQTNFRVDWLGPASGAGDYWERAEEFVAARRAGTITRSVYSFSETDMWWRG